MWVPMTPVVVEWRDAHADPAGTWVQPEHVDQRPYTVTSVGFLLPEGEGGKPGHVSIAQSWGRMHGDPLEALDHVLHLPTAMVTSVVQL